MHEQPPSDRGPLWLALAASAAWLGLVGWSAARLGLTAVSDPAAWIGPLGGAMAVPAALLALAAAVIAGRAQAGSAMPVAEAGATMEEAEARLAGAASRTEAVREALSTALDTIAHQTSALTAAGAEAARAAAALDRLGPAADAAADRLGPLADQSTAAATRLEALLAEVAARAQPGEAAALAAAAAAERAAAAVARGGVLIEQLTTRAAGLEAVLNGQLAAIDSLAVGAERSFQLLDARIAHRETTSQKTLERLGERIAGLHRAADALAEPLDSGRERIESLEASLQTMAARAADAQQLLAEAVPAATARAAAAIGEAMAGVAPLDSALARTDAHARALAAVVAGAAEQVEAAAAAHAHQRAAIEAAGQALTVELNQARTLLSDIETTAGAAALAAATRLVDQMAQAHEVAAGIAAAVRTALERVTGEARSQLAAAGREALEQDFLGPLDAALATVTDRASAAAETGRAAAERTASALAGLAQALARIEQHAAERRQALDTVAADDLAATAAMLTDRLAADAVQIASALDRPMDDADWKAWRQGERGLFARRARTLISRGDARALKQQLAADPELAGLARAYTARFDALLRRVDRDGDATGPLAVLLLSSEPGRLAAALTDVLAD